MQNPNQEHYTTHQDFLYNRALFGLSVYKLDEVVIMSVEKKKRIIRLHKKTQKIMNLWKQEIVNVLANSIFTDLFPDMEITKCLVMYYGTVGDPDYINNMSFKMLKISKKQIIDKLVETKILPKNFNQLTLKKDASRIFSKRELVPDPKSGEPPRGGTLEGTVQAGQYAPASPQRDNNI